MYSRTRLVRTLSKQKLVHINRRTSYLNILPLGLVQNRKSVLKKVLINRVYVLSRVLLYVVTCIPTLKLLRETGVLTYIIKIKLLHNFLRYSNYLPNDDSQLFEYNIDYIYMTCHFCMVYQYFCPGSVNTLVRIFSLFYLSGYLQLNFKSNNNV